MAKKKDCIYSMESIEAIIENPDNSWKNLFKETVISMIASNKNELLWYANFLSRCEYEYHFNETFTSAVYFNGKNFVIMINPVILGLIEKDQIIAILKHSAGHIINHHFSRSSKIDNVNKEIEEIAKDIVINGNREVPYIKDLPCSGNYKSSPVQALFYQSLTEKYEIEEYEVGREFEYYVRLIMESLEDTEESNASCDTNMEEDADDEINMALESGDDTDEDSEASSNSEQNSENNETDIESEVSQEGDENNEPFSNALIVLWDNEVPSSFNSSSISLPQELSDGSLFSSPSCETSDSISISLFRSLLLDASLSSSVSSPDSNAIFISSSASSSIFVSHDVLLSSVSSKDSIINRT
jgi:hypothetical protein